MENKVCEIALEEVCELIAGFAFKSVDFGNYPEKVIKIADIVPPNIYINSMTGVNIAQYNTSRISKYVARKGDFLLAMTGATIGKIGRLVDGQALVNQRVLLFRPKDTLVDKKFIYYTIIRKEFSDYIYNHIDSETAQPNISASSIGKYSIRKPSLIIQRSIAATLSCLDDKIELNNRIIANLEAQAQAIFKSWFVDFEPFQDGEFEESELGLIPKGWRVGTLKDICHYSNERVAVETLNDAIYISTENMLPNKRGFVKATSLPTTAYTTAYCAGNVLISNIRPYFKKIVYCYGEGGCSTDVICFVANDGIPSEYVFHLLYSDSFFDFMVGGSKGTKMPRGDKQQLMQYPVVQPDDKWLAEFERVAQPMLLQSYSLRQENERLALTRDTLLPKLMSGEIEVPVEG